ncbi:reverse transcriptase N-terminal domain-containing protein [Geminocystis herdmanii]|uniref:reverse transcriptase N-terminal domain-containing protein n=1 Tax=Geminocystis herdmanii TaxID=669359 RepID=UPI00037B6A4B
MTMAKPIDKANNWNTWQSVNWKVVEKQVFRLQKRIYRASQNGNVKLVHSLQRLLIKSYCGLNFNSEDLLEIDHIIPKSKGGKDIYNNLQVLHRHCHDDKTAKDDSLNRTHDKGFIREERNEAKVSRSVLKTSQVREDLA